MSEEEELILVAQMLNMTPAHIKDMIMISRDVTSLDTIIVTEKTDSSTLGELLEDVSSINPEENAISQNMKDEIDNLLSTLTEKEAEEVKAPVKKETVPGKEISAEDFLKDVFKAMDMEVEIKVTENKEEKSLDIELAGEEMGVLIGKRGQTLDSLQYLVSLVVNKYSDEYVRVKIDTENYRERRKETLENLARNIAYKVKRTRKTVSLEPMNPYERRVIHSALQNDRYVTTHSEGEEPYRRVVVTLKDNHHHRNYHKKGER